MALSFKVFADESGIHDETGRRPGSDVAGVVGYLGWNWQWGSFVGQFNQFVGSPVYRVRDFHMTTFMRARELPYRSWSHPKREMFRRGILQIVADNTTLGIGGLVVVGDYDKLMRPTRLYVPPYMFCFQLFFDTILKLVEEVPGISRDDQVAFVFDEQQQFKEAALDAYARIKTARDRRDRMGSITFSSRRQNHELYAADIGAWLMRDGLSRHVKGKSPRRYVQDLAKKHRLRVGYYDRGNLGPAIATMLRGQQPTP